METPLDAMDRARDVRRRHDRELMGIAGVEGNGIALDEEGRPVIEVYVSVPAASLASRIPRELEGVPVRIVETGPFEAR